jgi:hypothetical protein
LSWSIALFVVSVLVEKDWQRTRKLRLAIAVLFFLTFPYGFIAVRGLNAILDRSPATMFESHVLEKFGVGRFGYLLMIGPWGPVHGYTAEVRPKK